MLPTSEIARTDPLKLRGAVALAGIADLADFRTYTANICGDVIEGAGHHEVMSPRSSAWPAIVRSVRRLLTP